MEVLVLQHASGDLPAAYPEGLQEAGIRAHRCALDRGDAVPGRWELYDGIIAMGESLIAHGEGRLPWLANGKRLVSDAVRAGLPYWGVCFGGQLLAASLGGKVSHGDRPAGGVPLILLEAAGLDPVFRHAPRNLLRTEWQGEIFEPPPGSVPLAASSVCSAEAFRWGSAAYGLQFHIEVSPASENSHAGASAGVQARGADGEAAAHSGLMQGFEAAESGARQGRHAEAMLRAWLTLVARWSERKRENLLFQAMPR